MHLQLIIKGIIKQCFIKRSYPSLGLNVTLYLNSHLHGACTATNYSNSNIYFRHKVHIGETNRKEEQKLRITDKC